MINPKIITLSMFIGGFVCLGLAIYMLSRDCQPKYPDIISTQPRIQK